MRPVDGRTVPHNTRVVGRAAAPAVIPARTGTPPGWPRPPRPPAADRVPSRRGRGGRFWTWLLLVPIVAPLLTPLYNRMDPYLFGVPFFYWCQLAFVFLDIAVITLVYQATKWRS